MTQSTGLPMTVLEPGLDRLRVRRFRDELGRELYDLRRAPIPTPDTKALPRFLPRFDNVLLSHDDRRRAISDEHRALVIEGGEVRPTFLVDGFVAGTWSLDGSRVRLAPFDPLPRTVRREVETEAARLEAFVRASGKS
jgi:Winged helix DNA-binding domain